MIIIILSYATPFIRKPFTLTGFHYT